ncbi:MAG: DciA family protein [Cycloclasticus sp.]|nr:DciA family protein [Cycloclasticus sp.]
MLKQPFKNNHSSLQVLQQTQQNLARQRQLLQAVQTSLPDNLALHCLYAVAKKNSVTVFTDSSVWASKILYMRRTILDALSKQICDQPITLNVKVMTQQAPARQHRPKSPSHKTLQILSDANTLKPKDSLNESLINLFNTLKKNKLTD